jgi:hypothetical protein
MAGRTIPSWLLTLTVAVVVAGGCGDDEPFVPPPRQDLSGKWQPQPFALAPNLLAEAEMICRANDSISPDGRLMVADARGGGYMIVAFANLMSDYQCEIEGAGPGSLFSPGMTGRSSDQPRAAPAPAEVRSGTRGNLGGGESVTGQAGSLVKVVQILLPGGKAVQASLGVDGWFAAWWPNPDARVTINGYDANGTLLGTASP